MKTTPRALLLCLLLPAALVAQGSPGFEGLTSADGRAGGTLTQATPPDQYDLMVAVSDRTINRLTAAILDRQKPRADQEQLLGGLSVEFTGEGRMVLRGSYKVRASEHVFGGNFGFEMTTRLLSGSMNQLDLVIESASITEGGEEFLPRLEARHVARQLRFFSPSIERAGDAAVARLHQNLHKGLDPSQQSDQIDDLFSVVDNRLRLRILPRVLSPLLPPVKILWAGIRDRKLQVHAEF